MIKITKNTFILTLLIVFAISISLLYNLSIPKTFAADGFAGGTGIESDPYLIETSEQLALLNNYLGADAQYFELSNDIDLTEYLSEGGNGYNGGNGWKPIGIASPFNGRLDGKNFKITGLWINNSSSENAGLFGNIGNNGIIRNLGIRIGVNKVIGNYSGGIAGINYGTIENCYVKGDIEGKYAGGFVGYNSGSIKNCYAKGNINGTENAGGFAGASNKSIENCYSLGHTTGEGTLIGGFVGVIYEGSIKNCYSVVDTIGNGSYTGGFAGIIYNAGLIKNCYSTGNTTGSGVYCGGFAGYISGSVENCYSAGNTAGSGIYCGGFVGYNRSVILKNCYSTGTTTGSNLIEVSYAGGFAGSSESLMENCYSSGAVTGKRIGGFIGYNPNTLTLNNCYYDSTISGQLNNHGVPLTTEQMMKKESFSGWIFNNDINNIHEEDTWIIFEEGGHYPFLLTTGAVIIKPDNGQASEYGQTPNITFKVSGTVIGGNSVKPEDYYIMLGLEQYDIGERNILLNSFKIKGAGQVWFVGGIKYAITKISQPIVIGIELESATTSSITLTKIEGVEYRMGEDGEWQDSNIFSSLDINTGYIFYIRYKETDDKLAGSITSFTARTAKAPQDAINGVNAIDITSSSITLTEIEGAEYRLLEDGQWQDSNLFTGLNARTEYTFYFRYKETEDKAAGVITSLTARTANKVSQPGVTGVEAVITTPSSITLTEISGAEYKLSDNGQWQDSNIFTGLNADTEYTFYIRFKETEDKFAGIITSYTAKTDKKISQPGVTGVVAVITTHLSITLTEIEGVEYRLGEDGEWQDTNTFSGLKADTEYTFYIRFKETEDKLAGDIISYTARTAKKTSQPDITGVKAIKTTASSIMLTEINGAEYKLGENGQWQDSNIFSGLKANTEYTFYIRFKETEDKAAGTITDFTIKTDKPGSNAIIIGSVVIAAAGLFCLYWFKLRKRKAKK